MREILIAVCSYDGRIEASCALSIVQNMRYLDRKGYLPELHFAGYMCYLPVARNACLQYFLESTCTDIIFVDSDLTFETHAMYKLLQHEVGVVGGAYPYKKDDGGFVVCPAESANMDSPTLIEAEFIPTGLMRIKRDVIERIIAMPWFHGNMPRQNAQGAYTVFDTGYLFDDGIWYGEDIAFCKEWRRRGNKVWIEPDILFGHKGHKEYVGNYKEYLKKAAKV